MHQTKVLLADIHVDCNNDRSSQGNSSNEICTHYNQL